MDILTNIPDKTEYKNTTSLKFKRDLIEFFTNKELNVCLEIGTNHGHTTHILSHLFKEVYTIDLHQSNIDKAKDFNKERSNITYIVGDAYSDRSYKDVPRIDVCFIDCVHHYKQVMQDIQRALGNSSTGKTYLIFDDYGHPILTEVYQAVEDAIKQGLYRETFIGEEAGFVIKKEPTTLTTIHQEGVILSYTKN